MISQAANSQFCGRVPTHFAHQQKDWTGKDITVKGEEDKETEEKETTHNGNNA